MNGAQTSNQSLQPTAKIIVFISPGQVLAIHSRVLLGDVLARPVPVSAFWRYRVSLQRKKCCQQIIGLNDESFSVAVRIHAKKESMFGKMLSDAVRPALRV
jgi:hypothetical protein